MIWNKKIFLTLAAALAGATLMAADPERQPGVNPGPGTRYATDAYPGFDREDNILKPEKKTPRLFSFINGPKMSNAAEQYAWCQQCEKDGNWSKARRAYDALVREWPTAKEAPKSQQRVAEIYLEHDLDFEEAFEEYKYLMDFYSLECDYQAMAVKLYQVAELMREEGKRIMFFRFKNTTDVRRAYEAVVLRCPGASFAPKALLTIASLREDAKEPIKAVQVYENLRNIHPEAPEAVEALHSEARVRMKILEMHGYNRSRTMDTIDFLKLARRGELTPEMRKDVDGWLKDAENLLSDEAFESAKFYDSRTRTKRSAVNAYERFLEDYPDSPHAGEALKRLMELKEEEKK